MIFDVKIGGKFRGKARLVAGGHTTETPAMLTYSSVVSRDSVRIAFTVAALNGLDVMTCDIQNAYLTADCREKIWTRAGPEFGSEAGAIMFIRKALAQGPHSAPISRRPYTILALSRPEPILMFGIGQPSKKTVLNTMSTSCVMLMTSLPLAIRQGTCSRQYKSYSS